jgi:hypothetical protein
MGQMEFMNLMLAAAKKEGYSVGNNRNGDPQIKFDNKYLTADDLRRLFEDISRKRRLYSRDDMERVVPGRPCAVAPFFDLTIRAGSCTPEITGRKKVYKFDLTASRSAATTE